MYLILILFSLLMQISLFRWEDRLAKDAVSGLTLVDEQEDKLREGRVFGLREKVLTFFIASAKQWTKKCLHYIGDLPVHKTHILSALTVILIGTGIQKKLREGKSFINLEKKFQSSSLNFLFFSSRIVFFPVMTTPTEYKVGTKELVYFACISSEWCGEGDKLWEEITLEI